MGLQFQAIWELHQFFSKENIPYVITGNIALQQWGVQPLARDVLVTILIPSTEGEPAFQKILAVFPARIPNALEFAKQYRTCPIKVQEDCHADISLGIFGYEKEVMQRAIDYDLGEGRNVRICSAEDLIILKAVAGGPHDIEDIESVVLRQGKTLNMDYISSWLKDFSLLLEMDETLKKIEDLQKRLS